MADPNLEEWQRNFLYIDHVRFVVHRLHHRRRKIYRKRIDPFIKYSNSEFKRRYRVSKALARRIIGLIREELEHHNGTLRGKPISSDLQVLATLRYLGKGAYQQDMADLHGFSQPTLSRIIARVVRALARHLIQFIQFPQDFRSLSSIKEDFFAIAGMRNIIGAIDCTHIKIKNPGGNNPALYINRKGFFSLNVQVVCDANCKILDIVARWRGSAHDSRVWNECHLKRMFENENLSGILVGDSGYAASNYMLTPMLNPNTPQEERYNSAHIRTRNCVERLFGQLKNKFRCFFNGLNLSLETTKAAIIAIAIIHNLSLDHQNEHLDSENYSSSDDENDLLNNVQRNQIDGNVRANVAGNLFRATYIRNNF